MAWDRKVPYDKDGNMLSWESYDTAYRKATKPFAARMTVINFTRGRSAAGFLLEDEDERHYPMFLKDMNNIITGPGVGEHGVIEGTWEIVKRSANYGIALIEWEGMR